MKLIKGSDLLAIGESVAALGRLAKRMDPETFKRAVVAGCTAADMHLTCSYPECKCKKIPVAIKAAIAEWEQALTSGQKHD